MPTTCAMPAFTSRSRATSRSTETALLALRHAAPYVRKQLGFALNLRHTPALHFVRDTVEEKAARVDALLHEIEKSSTGLKGCALR